MIKVTKLDDCFVVSEDDTWVPGTYETEKSVFGTILKHNRPGISAYGQEVVIKNDFVKVEI